MKLLYMPFIHLSLKFELIARPILLSDEKSHNPNRITHLDAIVKVSN